jgi:C4-dicarboxylate-specific signal transduction histidine kinase
MRGASRDITRSHQVEQQVQRQRDDLAHLARVAALAELSGSLAHELRQPLTAILVNARAAQRVLERDGTDLSEVRSILGDIVADDQRAAEIIERLRHLFRKGEVRRQPTDVNELVRQVTQFAHGELVRTDVDLQTELATNLPPISGDDVQLQQVLLNLVANACHAMADGAASSRRLVVRTNVAVGDGVHVTVSDRGSGVPADDLERIFEPFVTSRGDGMGLGLAVCRTIIRAHGGTLWAENNAEGGASFHFVLPAGASS